MILSCELPTEFQRFVRRRRNITNSVAWAKAGAIRRSTIGSGPQSSSVRQIEFRVVINNNIITYYNIIV